MVENHVAEARKSMQALGTYKPEFEPIIMVYGQLQEQYDTLTAKFEKSRYKFSEDTAQGTKKAPIVTTLESLRKDILAYAAQLGLTPQGLLKTNENAFRKTKKSKMSEAIQEAQGT